MNKKLVVGMVAVAIVLGAGLSYHASVFAKNNDDNGKEHAKEAHDAGSTLEIHISDDGLVLVRGAKVASVASTSLVATTGWGLVSLNWTVMTDANTKFVHTADGKSSVSEISVGDIVSFSGSLDSSSSVLMVKAKNVKDWSIQKKHASFYGTVSSVSSSSTSFVLATEERGAITVRVGSSTVIKKGDSAGSFADIVVGAKVTAQGSWNTASNILEADSIKVHLPGVKRTTLEGKIKTLPGASTPTTMVITVKGSDYTVNIGVDTSVLNSLWLKLPLAGMRVGDKIRVYGAINANATVDATVIRDTSL